MPKDNKFYVYEHIRLDNMTCFYVGKGYNKRAYKIKRNSHHDNIAKKYGFEIKIIADGLSEKEALLLEKETIRKYVFELGYGIDIDGYNNYDHEKDNYLTNLTWGGEGTVGYKFTNEQKRNISIGLKYKYNNEGHPWIGKHHSKESRIKMSETKLKLFKEGKIKTLKNVPKSEEQKRKQSIAMRNKMSGSKNPMYGIHRYGKDAPNYGKKWTEEQKKKSSEFWKGKNTRASNPNSKKNYMHNYRRNI